MLIISANATCIDGTAAYGLKSELTGAVFGSTPVKSATLSTNPHSGKKRGGAVGKTM